MLILLILCQFFVKIKSFPLDFRISPETSPTNLLTSTHFYEIIPPRNDSRFHSLNEKNIIMKVVVYDEEINEIISYKNISLRSPFVEVSKYHSVRKLKNFTQDFPEIIKIIVYEKNEYIGESEIMYIYWDFTYPSLKFVDFKFKNIGQGKVEIKPISNNLHLHQYTRMINYEFFIMNGSSHCGESFSTNNVDDGVFTFNIPCVAYFKVTGHTSLWNSYTTSDGYSSLTTNIALVCCDNQTGNCPLISSEFDGIVHYVQTIKNNRQLPITREKVYIIENALIMFPLRTTTLPDYVDIIIPKDVDLSIDVEKMYGMNNLNDYDIQFNFLVTNSTDINDNKVFRVKAISSAYSKSNYGFQVFFKFGEELIVGEEYDIFLKLDNCDAQKMTVIPSSLRSIKLPKLLQTSFTYTNLAFIPSIETYKNIGFNTLPLFQIVDNFKNFSYIEKYTKSRRQEWAPDMNFCPSVFGFIDSSAELGLPYSMVNILNGKDTIDNDFFDDISGINKTEEMDLINNALEFYEDYGKIDIGYAGYFYQKSLEVYHTLFSYLEPEYINFDIEIYGYYDYFGNNISKNLENRRMNGESDSELIIRVHSEILGDIKNLVNEISTDIKYIFWHLHSEGDMGYGAFRFSNFDFHNFIPQPAMYSGSRIVESISKKIRNNRLFLTRNVKELIPCPTFGLRGTISLYETVFDSCIQMFSNGATGIQFFPAYIFDHLAYLSFSECVSIFSEVEEIVMYGNISYNDFNLIENVIVGSMSYDDEYIIGISKDINHDGENAKLILPYSNADHKVVDLRKTEINENNMKIRYANELITIELSYPFDSTVLHIKKWKDSSNDDDDDDVVWTVLIAVSISILLIIFIIIIFVLLLLFFSKKKKKNEYSEELNSISK